MSKLKTFVNWLQFWREKEFPEPKDHSLTIEELLVFWSKRMTKAHKSECAVIVYRLDPARATGEAMVRYEGASLDGLLPALESAVTKLTPGEEYFAEHPEIEDMVFCVRIQRTWKTRNGSRSEEVCVSTFDVGR